MLILILLLLLLWVVLAILLTAWSMWFQGYLYTEPSTGLVWRGPAAASAIMAIILLWVIMDYRSPGRFRPIWESSSTEAGKSFPELRVPAGKDKEDVYLLRPGTRGEYRQGGGAGGKAMPSTPPRIVVIEDGQRSTFEPERDAKGNFLRRRVGGVEEPLRYIDEKGRVMREGSLGQLESFRGGVFVGNVFLNVLLVGGSFAAIWLLTRFQWPHALGHAVALSLLLMLFVLPPLLTRAEAVARQRAAQRPV